MFQQNIRDIFILQFSKRVKKKLTHCLRVLERPMKYHVNECRLYTKISQGGHIFFQQNVLVKHQLFNSQK